MLAIYYMESLNKTTKQTQTLSKTDAITGVPFIDCLDLDGLIARCDYGNDVKTRKAYEKRFRVLSQIDAAERTALLLLKRRNRIQMRLDKRLEGRGGIRQLPTFKTEASEVGDMSVGGIAITTTKENVIEHDGEESDIITDIGVSLRPNGDGVNTQYSLDKFFERPVSIYDATWDSDTEYNTILKPWNLWSLDPTVRAKLSNYSYFRGTLNVKVSISGTPYHYGRAMLSYQAYAKYNSCLVTYDTLYAAVTNPTDAMIHAPYKCYLSQSPGVAYVDVKENQPTVMQLPFISHKPKFRLFNDNNNVITPSTEYVDFEEAGELRLVTLNPFKVANADYDSFVTINVYAWVTDIELGSITGTDMDITAQSKRIYKTESLVSRAVDSLNGGSDEYKEPGPVELAATAVTKIGLALGDAPIIGPFARATASFSSQFGKMAAFFGWAKPVILDKTVFVKNQPFVNGAFVTAHETSTKITLDPKQELSVDQNYGGRGGIDEMTIESISSRESFLTSFTWDDSDVAMTTVLWKTLVSPHLVTGIPFMTSDNDTTWVQPTSLCYAVTPFNYWRGKIKFRLEFVVSKFHRGKILIKFDPNVAQHVLISSNTSKLNQQNTMIIDIQDAQEISFEIDWAHRRSWAHAPDNLGASSPLCDLLDIVPPATATFGGFDTTVANGWFEVRPLNELIQPTSTATVPINVFVSCDDLQVARLTEELFPQKRLYKTESKEMPTVTETLNPTGSSIENLYLDNFGERIVSFRSLLKRYVTTGIMVGTNSQSNIAKYYKVGYHYPKDSCPFTTSAVADGGNAKTLYSYLRTAYMGMRGGYRHRVIDITNLTNTPTSFTRVTTSRPTVIAEEFPLCATVGLSGFNNIVGSPSNTILALSDGTVNFQPHINNGIEFETPFQTDNLFLFSSSNRDFGIGTGLHDMNPEMAFTWQVQSIMEANTGDDVMALEDTAPAEDFTFLRYLGAPAYTRAI